MSSGKTLFSDQISDSWHQKNCLYVMSEPSRLPGLIYLMFYVMFNSQGHFPTGSLQVKETSAYCTVNHQASASNCQLSHMKRPARDSNRRPQRFEVRTLTATPPSPLPGLNLVQI